MCYRYIYALSLYTLYIKDNNKPLWIYVQHYNINPCPAELFQSFHSFEAGIANAISSFKWWKTFPFMKNKHLPDWNIWLAEHLPLNILSISVAFYLGWNFLENVYIRVQQDKG